jgi:hypothetical protein
MLLKEWVANAFKNMQRPVVSILAEHIMNFPNGAGGRPHHVLC